MVKEQERYLAAHKSKGTASSQGGETSGQPGKKQRHSDPAQSQARGSRPQQPSGRGESRGQGATTQTAQICAHFGRPHTGECRLLTRVCIGCGQQGHFLRDCLYKRDTEAGISEPTVQQLRQGGTGTTAGQGRGQGQAASSVPTRGRPGTQTYQ